MNFSSLLSEEINKKRKQAQENRGKRAKVHKENAVEAESSNESTEKQVSPDTQPAKNAEEQEGVEVVDLISYLDYGLKNFPKPVLPDSSDPKSNSEFSDGVERTPALDIVDFSCSTSETTINTNDTAPAHNSEEAELLESIADKQLDSKLQEFGEFNESDSKLTKIKKLQAISETHQKKQKYKDVIEREAEINNDPQLKVIALDSIASIEANKEKLHTILRVVLKDWIREWEIEMETTKSESSDFTALLKETLFETKADLVKLLYKLRSFNLTTDMLTSLATIAYYVQENDFRRANESYMKLSIGNVAWPIGVQDVGIHARSALSKISGLSKSSNIMIDDKTRRWITAVKRLLTFKEKQSKR